MISKQDVTPGMLVYTRDNRRLGRISRLEETRFVVEHDRFGADAAVEYADVGERIGEVLYLVRDADWFSPDKPIQLDPPQP
jgi:hypothetical protein